MNTEAARDNIMKGARWSAKKGPWTITDSEFAPPNGNVHDYLSWAPYHWPNCRWCSNGRNHLAKPGSDGDSTPDWPADEETDISTDPYAGGSDFWDATGGDTSQPVARAFSHTCNRRSRRYRHRKRFVSRALSVQQAPDAQLPTTTQIHGEAPTLPISDPDATTTKPPQRTPPPNNAAAKKTQKGGCTPSPTTSMEPRETWSTCPYVVRDGKVNPDVRKLQGVQYINEISQAVLFNALAFVFEGAAEKAENVAEFLYRFFLDPETMMNPHLGFGQMVRGPGKYEGTFTGILDFRGMIKVVNAVTMLKAKASVEWAAKEQAMQSWMGEYAVWLTESPIGRITASKSNNHLTFYVAQLAAVKMFIGDREGAIGLLKGFFDGPFMDQIAASGEQPFEAVRTRPFHYRCFNLEAMIVNAKLGDQLGVDFWTAKTKYGATIQTAVDYAMSVNPKKERVAELAPHVAAVLAAYGDPDGKYQRFLEKIMPGAYTRQSFWFYSQPGALPQSPAGRSWQNYKRKEVVEQPEAAIAFECPTVFQSTRETELDNGIFVTCEDVMPFYGIQV